MRLLLLVLRLVRGVQAALGVLRLFPPPAAGAQRLARQQRPRARRAADRAVALVVEAVVGNLARADGVPHVGLAPRGERVEFLDGVGEIELALRQVGARRRMLAPLA